MKSSPDDHYWLEMFHRTLFQGDQCAKEQFQQHFSKVVLAWLRLHPKQEEVYRFGREEYYLVQAFACFWQAMSCHKELKISQLAAVLQYLQASLNGVIIDTLRAYSYRRESSRPRPDFSPDFSKESATTAQDNNDEVWKNLCSLLSDTREQRLAYLLFHCGLKPGEVAHLYPREFSDGQEISRVRHNIIERVLLSQK